MTSYRLSVLFLLAFVLAGPAAPVSADEYPAVRWTPGIDAGSDLPDEMLSLTDDSRNTLLLYWNPTVPASVEELLRLQIFASEAGDSWRIVTAARAIDDTEREIVTKALAQRKITLPVLLDRQLAIARGLGVPHVPAYAAMATDGTQLFKGFTSLEQRVDKGGTLRQALAAKRVAGLAPAPKAVPRKGEQAPAIALPDIAGAQRALSDFLGKGRNVMVLFWSPYCPHCRNELPRIQRYLTVRKHPFDVVSITRMDGPEDRIAVDGFLREHQITFPVLVDGGAVLATYGVRGIPHWLMLDEDGRILTIETGEKRGLEGLLRRFE